MRAVLADMAIEVEAATALVIGWPSFDLAASDARRKRRRLLTPTVKYWVYKTAPALVYEAMECLGGNGYVEENLLPRLYREAPVNAIWEGRAMSCASTCCVRERASPLMSAVLDAVREGNAGLPGASPLQCHSGGIFRRSLRQGRLAVGQLALLARLPCANVRRRLPKCSRARGCMSAWACWERASSGPTKPRSCSTGHCPSAEPSQRFHPDEMLRACRARQAHRYDPWLARKGIRVPTDAG
jgi:hypothetical protein